MKTVGRYFLMRLDGVGRPAAVAGIAIGALIAAAPGQAQVRPVARDITITTGVSVVAESNVARASEESARIRGLDQGDLRTTPTVTADISLPFGRNYLLFNGVVGYDFYARNTRLNRERIDLNTTAGLNYSNCELVVNGSYLRRQSDLGDLVFIDAAGAPISITTNTEEIKTVGANASCGAPVGLRPTAGISQTWADNDTVFRQFSNYRTTSITGGLAYRQPSLGELSIFASKSWTEYSNRPLPTGEDDGTAVRSYGARYQRNIGSRLYGLLELSYTDVNADNPFARDFGGLTWRGELTGTVSDRLRLVGSFGRSVESSNLVASSYYVLKDYTLDASYGLSDRVTLTAGAFRRERDYEGTGLLLGQPLVQEELTTFRGGVTYRATPRLSFVIDAAHETRDANSNFLDYDNDRVGLTARYRW